MIWVARSLIPHDGRILLGDRYLQEPFTDLGDGGEGAIAVYVVHIY